MISTKIITLLKDILKCFLYINLETDYWNDNWNLIGSTLILKEETFAQTID